MSKLVLRATVILGLLLIIISGISAQEKQITITGTVLDEKNQPLPFVNIIIKNQPGIGTSTDTDGKYSIKAGENDILVFAFLGYEKQEVPISGKTELNVTMQLSAKTLEEITVVGQGTQRKVSVVGAISTVQVATLKTNSSSQLSNSLAGNVAGIIAVQRSGEPGQNNSEFWIRGIGTFGANSAALVLVDGIERNFNEVNVEDIESFSVLKDASATAVYGNRGANGVVIITTKRGQEGKVSVNLKVESGVTTSTSMPKYLSGDRYASLANEASVSRGREAIYSPSEIEIINNNLDPDLYPNIDWRNEMLKKSTNHSRATLNVRGGGALARYFISGGYTKEDGIYAGGNVNQYKTNVDYTRYNFRSNVDVNITKTTIIELGISGWIVSNNKPGNVNSDVIWNNLANLTPIAVPKLYSNGYTPAYGSTADLMSPYALLYQTGYTTNWSNKLESNIALKQDLKFITEGLRFTGRFSYDSYNTNTINRIVMPDLYRAEKQRDANGALVLRKVVVGFPLIQGTSGWGDKRYYSEMSFNYDRTFASKHRLGGLLFFYAQGYSRNDAGSNILASVPKRNMALSGRVTYSYADKYMFEYNFGYTGSENFEKGSRFGFFPAYAVGWNVANESFLKDAGWADLLKIRFSYGEVGNDRMSKNGQDYRFPYLTLVQADGTLLRIGAQDLTWEIAKKTNLGIDMGLFNRFTLTVDFFKDNRSKIFMERNYLNQAVAPPNGVKPWANVGAMQSKGMDASTAYTFKADKFQLTVRGNFTYSNNKVQEYDEASNALYYQMTKGYKWQQTKGLIALGLYKDQEDIDNSPKSTYSSVLPGDIKYKDVNGDGVINDNDYVPIGHSTIPEVVYGFGLSAQYRSFDASILFQGTGNCDFMMGGSAANPYSNSDYGNVLQIVDEGNNRWISRDISGNPATENPNAIFPRLSYGPNLNNQQNSTFWLRNSRYLRIKNAEIGYNLPKKTAQKLRMAAARIYLLGNNLHVFSPFKLWDPELASGNGAQYPIQISIDLGINITF